MDFSKHIQKAEEAERRRNYDFAVQLYQQLLEIDPDQGPARSGLRRVLKKRHEGKKGSRLLRAIGGAAPLVKAKAMRKAGRHDSCTKALEKYLETNPLNEEGNLLLGMSLEDGGHFNSARAVYEFVAEIAPRSPEGLKRAGAMMQRTGEPARALEYYERALDVDPRDQEAHKARKNLAAETALSAAQYESVKHSRDQIKDKDKARALDRAQRMHLSAEELEQELARLQDRYAETPSDPDLLVEMSGVHEKLKDPEAALEMIERALEYRKDSFELRDRAGDLKTKIFKHSIAKASKDGDEQRANQLEQEFWRFEIEEIRRRVALQPGSTDLRLKLGQRLMRVAEYDEAVAELQRAVSDPRMKADALFLLGQCFQKKGFPDLARREYQKALDDRAGVDERTKEILYNLGAIAEAEDDRDEARSFYARVFEVDIGFRDVAKKMEDFR